MNSKMTATGVFSTPDRCSCVPMPQTNNLRATYHAITTSLLLQSLLGSLTGLDPAATALPLQADSPTLQLPDAAQTRYMPTYLITNDAVNNRACHLYCCA
jgi:hypothetical protein